MKQYTQGHADGNIKDNIVRNIKFFELVLSHNLLGAIIQRLIFFLVDNRLCMKKHMQDNPLCLLCGVFNLRHNRLTTILKPLIDYVEFLPSSIIVYAYVL